MKQDLFALVSSVAGRSGSGLLSRGLSLSIMGAGAFHGRVRDGIGCRRSALEPPGRRKTDVLYWGFGIGLTTDVALVDLMPSLGMGRSLVIS